MQRFRRSHPDLWQFIVFSLTSSAVTLFQLAAMPLFKALLGATPLLQVDFSAVSMAGGYLFNYPAGPISEGGGGGLAYFLAVQLALLIAQVINFFTQRNVTFHSHVSIPKAAFWYALAYGFITLGAAALQNLYKAPVYAFCLAHLGALGEAAGDLITMLINSMLSFFIFYPIFRFIFRKD